MTSSVNCSRGVFLLLLLFISISYLVLKRDKRSMFAMDSSEGYSKRIFKIGEQSTNNVTHTSGTYVSETEVSKHLVTDQSLTVTSNQSSNEYNLSSTDTRRLFVHLRDIRISTRSVFFIESRCATEKLLREAKSSNISLNPRQACAVESTAVTNPGRDVYILHTCPVKTDDFFLQAPEYVRMFLDYPNVRIVIYNITEMFANTPVEGLATRRGLEKSSFPVEHASDVLRLTMLWKFGGTYLDMDVVTIRSLDDLNSNFCGLESENTIGNAVLNFEPRGLGHDMLTTALQHINDHFDGSRWAANGPDLVTQLVLQTCDASFANVTNCTKITVFNHTVLYPVYWWDHAQLFDTTMGPALVDDIKRTAYLVHIWNKQSHSNRISVGSSQGYALLADEFCPNVYRNCGDQF